MIDNRVFLHGLREILPGRAGEDKKKRGIGRKRGDRERREEEDTVSKDREKGRKGKME